MREQSKRHYPQRMDDEKSMEHANTGGAVVEVHDDQKRDGAQIGIDETIQTNSVESDSEDVHDPIIPPDILEEEEDVPIPVVLGYAFDIMSIVISLLDLATDIFVMSIWYSLGRMAFFWIGFSLLILAQLSYVVLFYFNHEPRSFMHLCGALCCTLPCIPFYSILFYLVGDKESCFRDFDYFCTFNTASTYSEDPALQQYLDQKLFRNLGFLLESICEAFPMSILQLRYVCESTRLLRIFSKTAGFSEHEIMWHVCVQLLLATSCTMRSRAPLPSFPFSFR